MKTTFFAIPALAFVACAMPVLSHASLMGDTIDIQADYPSAGATLSDYGQFTVGNSGSLNILAGVNLQPNQFTVTDFLPVFFGPATFSGLVFTDVSGDPGITGATLDASSTISGETVTYNSSQVFLNLSGMTVDPGDKIAIDLQFAPPTTGSSVTPEPSSFALLGTGMLGVAGMVRRRLLRA